MAEECSVGVVGSIIVNLDKELYAPGETISGSVTLTALEPIHSKEPLSVVINGHEHVSWDEGDTPSTLTYEKALINHKVVLAPGITTYEAGESVYRFSYELPSTLPASLAIENVYFGTMERLHVEIKYAATVWLAKEGDCVGYLSGKQSFTVHSPAVITPPVRVLDEMVSENVRLLCCFDGGVFRLSSSTAKDVCTSGESIQLKCQLDNTGSKVNIQRISMELIQDIAFSDVGERSGFVVSRVLSSQIFTGVEAGQTAAQTITLKLVNDDKCFPICPSVLSYHFSTTYRIELSCKTFFGRVVKLELPLRILHKATPVSPATIDIAIDKEHTSPHMTIPIPASEDTMPVHT